MHWYKRAQAIEKKRQQLLELADVNYMMALPDNCELEQTPNGMWRVYLTSGSFLDPQRTMLVNDEPDPKNAVKLAILRTLMLGAA